MYSATGEKVNVIQHRSLINKSLEYNKTPEVNKPFDFADILKEDQHIGTHIRANIKKLCYAQGMTMTSVFRQAAINYGVTINAGTVSSLGYKGQKFSTPYIRLLEIALQLVLGYHFTQFDLVFKEYYTGKDELPNILPPGERDTFTNRTKK